MVSTGITALFVGLVAPVYLFYIGGRADPRHGPIANALGGVVSTAAD